MGQIHQVILIHKDASLTAFCIGKVHSKQISDFLGTVYPAMFKYDGVVSSVPAYSGYGLGGMKGLKGLPDRICNLV